MLQKPNNRIRSLLVKLGASLARSLWSKISDIISSLNYIEPSYQNVDGLFRPTYCRKVYLFQGRVDCANCIDFTDSVCGTVLEPVCRENGCGEAQSV